MILYNTTFQVEMAEAQNLVIFLHESYIPEATKSGMMKNPRLARIISHQDENSECFSVQFETESVATIHKWYTTEGKAINDNLIKLFKDKVVGFPTMMEVIE